MKRAKTATERKQAQRALFKKHGFVERTFWVRKTWLAKIREFLDTL